MFYNNITDPKLYYGFIHIQRDGVTLIKIFKKIDQGPAFRTLVPMKTD